MLKQVARVILFLSFFLMWEYAGRTGLVNKYLLPAPSSIMQSELFADWKFVDHILSSLQRVLVGYSIATVSAISLAFMVGLNRHARFYGMPFLSLIRPVPPIAWIPIAILWFGIGNGPSYFVTMIASFFPIFFNTLSGIDDLDGQYLNVASCFGANKKQTFCEVVFPYTLPFILTGMRIGLGVAWMSVIAAEIVSASSGLGYMMEISQQMLRVDNVILGMVIIGFCGIVLDQGIQKMSTFFVRWKH